MIYLLRHGLDDENFIGGWSDVPLIEEGENMVYDSSLWIKDNLEIKDIISSDILRALQTSEIVSQVLNIPYQIDEDLREQSKGLLNGMLKSKAIEVYPDYIYNVDINTIYPNGSSLKELYEHMRKYLEKIKLMEDNTLLVTHRGNINMLYYLLNEIPLDMDKKRFNVEHASVHEIDIQLNKIRRIK